MLSRRVAEPVDVVNAAVAGWGPNHYLLEARSELAAQRYDLVLVFLFLGNDVVAERVDSIPARSPAPRHRLRMPRALSFQELKDSIARPLNDALETRSHLFTFAKNRLKFLRIRLGLYPYGFSVFLLRSAAAKPWWSTTAEVAADIAAEARAHQAETIFVLLPLDYQVDLQLAERHIRAYGVDPADVDLEQPARLLTAALDERDLHVLDTTPLLRAEHLAGREGLYGSVDTHFGPAGHRAVAEALAPHALRGLLAGSEDSMRP
jgi:hypothetical protein